MANSTTQSPRFKTGKEGMARLIQLLKQDGFHVIGPMLGEGAVVYGEIGSIDDLPKGWTDEQSGGKYLLKKRDDEALFGYVLGPDSIKRFLFPPEVCLWKASREGKQFRLEPTTDPTPKYAFLGARPCDIHAMLIQDKVFMGGQYKDADYTRRREQALIIAAHCTQAGANCFCSSMQTGPKADTGFDLAFTEVVTPKDHFFVMESGTDRGRKYLDQLAPAAASDEELKLAGHAEQKAVNQITRTMDTTDIRGLLDRNFDHRRWDQVAARCLACANCTMVCPTCFCMNVEDVTDLTGHHAERRRKWDSCFTYGHTYIHGGSTRFSGKARYRQWLTHKLSYWIDQFGQSGCVGCGRCITWCPVGIDLTEEVQALRADTLSPTLKQGRM